MVVKKFNRRLWACKYCGSHIPNDGTNNWTTTNTRICDSEKCRTIQSIGERPPKNDSYLPKSFWDPKISPPQSKKEIEESVGKKLGNLARYKN